MATKGQASMIETFRLKIVSKRQVTIPQRLLNLLGLTEGDELQIDVANNQIQTVRALKAVPTDLFTPKILEELSKREASQRSATAKRLVKNVADLRRNKRIAVSA